MVLKHWLPIVILLVLIASVAISMAEMPEAYTRSQIDAARNIYGEQDAVIFGVKPDVDMTVPVSKVLKMFHVVFLLPYENRK